jgi:hypothetical protein
MRCRPLQFDHGTWKSGYIGNHRFPSIAIKRSRPPCQRSFATLAAGQILGWSRSAFDAVSLTPDCDLFNMRAAPAATGTIG